MIRHMRGRSLGCILVAVAACEPGEIALVQPGTSEGGVSRNVFTVRAVVDPVDSPLADSLGWRDGVPGAEIHLLLNGTAEWITLQTDPTGSVEFERLLPGLYRVYAGRVLTEAEAAKGGGVVRAFGDGRTVEVGGKAVLELAVLGDRPRTLVISEIGNGVPVSWETAGSYWDGTFFEVYNNSDSTIYLDGKILGFAFPLGFMDYTHTPCSLSAPIRTDPEGLYVRRALAFPGSGTDYPIGPGEVRTVATAAIDHTPVHWTLLDLSHADFEIGGERAGDNPTVPNMLDVGLDRWIRGLLASRGVFFLGEQVELTRLPVVYRFHLDGSEYARVPKEKLLDVVALQVLRLPNDAEFPPCAPMVHRSFDRYEGGFLETGVGTDPAYNSVRGYQRRVLRVAPDGRRILMNTNTSAVDFIHDLKTPGALPEWP